MKTKTLGIIDFTLTINCRALNFDREGEREEEERKERERERGRRKEKGERNNIEA